LSGSKEVIVSEISNSSDNSLDFPKDLSFFRPYLQFYLREILEVGGEAYVSKTSDGAISGVFMYDDYEKTGTIFTRSRDIFDEFYGMKAFGSIFAEVKVGDECETYDIYTSDLADGVSLHRFSHEISVADEADLTELERFMLSADPRMNRKWVNVALNDGEKCFLVRLDGEIAGIGWLSIVNHIGRLHSLYVKPQLRRLGIGEDLVHARLLWLKSKNAKSAFSEISRYSPWSSRIALRAQMKISGQVFEYFKRNPSLG
jgi:GNAT superfamily N-acetyltransferase